MNELFFLEEGSEVMTEEEEPIRAPKISSLFSPIVRNDTTTERMKLVSFLFLFL